LKFVDFYAGQVIEAGPYRIDEESIIEFARSFDPQPFHIDRHAAEAGQWHGLIASGWHTCSIAMRLVVDYILSGSDSCGSPGIEYVKWPAPVRPADVLRLRVEVLDARRSRSGQYGIVRWRWLLSNQEQQIALDLVATSLFGGPTIAGSSLRS
jgi:acyl dehydratase